jgi:hypothetical protein
MDLPRIPSQGREEFIGSAAENPDHSRGALGTLRAGAPWATPTTVSCCSRRTSSVVVCAPVCDANLSTQAALVRRRHALELIAELAVDEDRDGRRTLLLHHYRIGHSASLDEHVDTCREGHSIPTVALKVFETALGPILVDDEQAAPTELELIAEELGVDPDTLRDRLRNEIQRRRRERGMGVSSSTRRSRSGRMAASGPRSCWCMSSHRAQTRRPEGVCANTAASNLPSCGPPGLGANLLLRSMRPWS